MGNRTASAVLTMRDLNESKHGSDILVPAGPKKFGARRFTEEEVREIRRSRETNKALAEKYGVKAASIQQIRDGRNYAWVID